MASPRRVLVVEDDTFTSGLICAALEGGGFEVKASPSAAQARRDIDAFDPDAAVIDLDLGAGATGVDLAHVIHVQYPGIAQLLLTKLRDLRAAGYTEADLPPTCSCLRKEDIGDARQLVAAVERALSDQVRRLTHQPDSDNPLSALTATQFAVLRAVAQGYSTPRIAEMRGTSTSAVEKVLSSIYDVLRISKDDGVSPRSEAMRYFVQFAGLPPRD